MATVKEIITGIEGKMHKSVDALRVDLASLRAGRATPSLLEKVMVDYYGSMTPIQQVGSISSPEPRMLVIQPWDATILKEIEKAINKSELGISPQNDGKVIRLNFPPLTEERRKELLKKAKAAGENAKVSVRNARRDGIEHLKKANKEGMPEDLQKEYEQLIQKETDAFTKKVDELVVAKEKEMMTV